MRTKKPFLPTLHSVRVALLLLLLLLLLPENAARYFMAALRDDFKLPVRHGNRTKKPRQSPAPSIVEEVTQIEEERRAAAEKLGQNESSPGHLQS
jgi:hypothetical protein